jgi:hypothetical protein
MAVEGIIIYHQNRFLHYSCLSRYLFSLLDLKSCSYSLKNSLSMKCRGPIYFFPCSYLLPLQLPKAPTRVMCLLQSRNPSWHLITTQRPWFIWVFSLAVVHCMEYCWNSIPTWGFILAPNLIWTCITIIYDVCHVSQSIIFTALKSSMFHPSIPTILITTHLFISP